MERINNFVHINWNGPLTLQGSCGELYQNSPVAKKPGIYLFTVEYNNGFLVYMAGVTMRSFKKRLKEHIREYRKGTYTIFDCGDLRKGKRTELWHGMWTKKSTNTPEMRGLFQSREKELGPAIENLLCTFRIFLAPLEVEKRTLERIEAAIMMILYSETEPICTIPDRGMFLAPRWISETPFMVYNMSDVYLHGLPEYFEA